MLFKRLVALSLLLISLTLLIYFQPVSAGGLTVVSLAPAPRTLTVPVTTTFTIQFDQPVNPDTIDETTFHVFGRWSGDVTGTYSFADSNQTVILTPTEPLSAGEQVMVVLSAGIEAAGGGFLRDAGYSYQFWTKTAVTDLTFTTLESMSTRSTPSQPTQAYGGVATDFDDDGWLDISIINEITADVRVFLNKGNRTFDPFLEPTTPVGDRASPSEPADFDGDGFADLAVANIDDGTVSILIGNGDGSFAPQQVVTVGSVPRGIAVLDADGDGDLDIANTNAGGSGSISLLLNDGTGTFGAPTFFDGGGDDEWALAAADMNEDHILDLIVGARDGANNRIIVVNAGNGDGTFSVISTQFAGGSTWMLTAGDVNGDGHEDIGVVNSSSNHGAILLGDGNGNLAAPVTSATDPFPLATDFGDIDGDGDLDWITSSYSGDWRLFINDGAGNFTFLREFPAPSAASCSLMFDFDNDGDLDLALIDEVADLVILVENENIVIPEPPDFMLYLPTVRQVE